MTKIKNQLLGSASFTSLNPMMSQMLRGSLVTHAPENDGGSAGGGDNQGGNPGTGSNDSGGGDNPGSGFNPEAFWNEPKPAAPASPQGGSADSGAAGGGQQQQQENPGRALAERIDQLPFGEVFNEKNIEELSAGNMAGVNAAIQGQLRDAARHSLVLSAQLIQQVIPQLLGQVEAKIQEALGTRDNSDTLLKEFPSAKNPAVRPMIQGVFDQAMRIHNGDRTMAVATTKEMLKHVGKTAAGDMDLTTPPANPADTYSNPSASRLVDELLGRQT